jgi:LacI family transcriptional regulator
MTTDSGAGRRPESVPRTKRATLAAVSAEAGVSLATVSKVLNGRADVAPATRARVEQLLREHRYVPPAGRRTAPAGRTLELVFDDLLSTYSCELLRGVVSAADESGIGVVVGRTPDGGSDASPSGSGWGRRLAAEGRSGVIVVTSELTEAQIAGLERARIPLVVIDPVNLPRADVASVGSTNWSGGLAATEHLISLGHRRIAYAGGGIGAACDQARLHGYLAALRNAGLAPDPELVTHGQFDFRTGRAAGAHLLALAEPPTAVFAACDQIAFGLMEAARESGLAVPRDLSVIGFDDTFAAEWSTPQLTTIRQPLQEMGRVAVRTLAQLGAGDALDSHHVELATHLVLRASTAPPSAPPR